MEKNGNRLTEKVVAENAVHTRNQKSVRTHLI